MLHNIFTANVYFSACKDRTTPTELDNKYKNNLKKNKTVLFDTGELSPACIVISLTILSKYCVLVDDRRSYV